MRVGQRCASCGRPMRPTGSRVADWPGTVVYSSHGLCIACDKARAAGRPLGPRAAYGARPHECVGCRRTLRPPQVPAGDAPNTVSYAGHGMCRACRDAVRQGRTREPGRGEYRQGVHPCRGCERPTRPNQGLATEFPGTIQRWSKGFCRRCHGDGTASEVLRMAETLERWKQQRGTHV